MRNTSKEYRKALYYSGMRYNEWARIELVQTIDNVQGPVAYFKNEEIKEGSFSIHKKMAEGDDSNIRAIGKIVTTDVQFSVLKKTDEYDLSTVDFSNPSTYVKCDYGVTVRDETGFKQHGGMIGLFKISEVKENGDYYDIKGYDFSTLLDKPVDLPPNIPYAAPAWYWYEFTILHYYDELHKFVRDSDIAYIKTDMHNAINRIKKRCTWLYYKDQTGTTNQYNFLVKTDMEHLYTWRDLLHDVGLLTLYGFQQVASGAFFPIVISTIAIQPDDYPPVIDGKYAKRIQNSKTPLSISGTTYKLHGVKYKYGDDSKLVMDFGEFPLPISKIDSGDPLSDSDYTGMMENMSNYLTGLPAWHPCSVDWLGDPSLMLGDAVRVNDRIIGRWSYMIITESNWTFHGICQTKTVSGTLEQLKYKEQKAKKEERKEDKVIDNRMVKYKYAVNNNAIDLNIAPEEQWSPTDWVKNKLIEFHIQTGEMENSDIFVQGMCCFQVDPSEAEEAYDVIMEAQVNGVFLDNSLNKFQLSNYNTPVPFIYALLDQPRNSTINVAIYARIHNKFRGSTTKVFVEDFDCKALASGSNIIAIQDIQSAPISVKSEEIPTTMSLLEDEGTESTTMIDNGEEL